MRSLLLSSVVAAVLFAPCLACQKAEEKPLVGGVGKQRVAGNGIDLRLTRDRAYAAFLKDPVHPIAQGIAPSMMLGKLVVASLTEGASRELGTQVTNMPGGYLFSPDSHWLLYVRGYNLAAASGQLELVNLKDKSEPVVLGRSVTFSAFNADGSRVGFIDAGVLKVVKPGDANASELGAEVRVAQFSPNGKGIAFRRTFTAGGALVYASLTDEKAAPVKLGDRAGDYDFSPDGKWLAFQLESDASRDVFDLYLTRTESPAAKKVAKGTDVFAFSADGKWLGRTEGYRPGKLGSLVVGPTGAEGGRQLGEFVERFSFSPSSNAVVAFEKHNDHPRLGTLKVTQLPKGDTRLVTAQADTYSWSGDGKFIAFNVEVYRPLPAILLYWYALGAEKPTKVDDGVYGFMFTPKGDDLLFRSQCTKGEGGVMPRACELKQLDLMNPKAPPKTLVSGIYSFRLSDDGSRMLVTYVRWDSDAYDTAAYNMGTGQRVTLDEHTALPPQFLTADGKRVAYLITGNSKAGLYTAEPAI